MRSVKTALCGALVITGWLATGAARADWPNGGSPIHVDAKFDCRLDVRFGHQHWDLGPWYAYFPSPAQYGNFGPIPGRAPGWGVQVRMTGAGPLPPPSHALGGYGLPPSYWYEGR
jgi:hypothetical protein